jgi:hypothetical protein
MQASGGFKLTVRRGPQPNQVYELTKDIITLGRDITNDIVVNDPEVSRHHARLTRTPNGYTLEDLGSTNGTFVNGHRLAAARPLTNGDMMGMGETVTMAYEATTAPVGQSPQVPGQAPAPTGGTPPMGIPPQQPPAYHPPPQPQQPPYGEPYQQPQQPYGQQPPYGAPQQDLYGQQQVPPHGAAQQEQGYGAYNQQQQQAPVYGAPYEQQQQAGYPPGEQAAYAAGYYPEEQQGSALRYVLLGCGFLVVLCVVMAVVAVVIIDTGNLWCDIPLGPTIVDLVGGVCPTVVP